jgi:hypothetical protein
VELAPIFTELVTKKYSGIDSPYNGEVHTGYVDTAVLEKNIEYLVSNNLFVNESFDYELLEVIPGGIRYRDRKQGILFFAEGFGMHANPYFKFALRWYKRRVIYY